MLVALLAEDQLPVAREVVPAAGDDVDPGYLAGFDAIDADPAHDLVVGVTADGRVVATMQLTTIPGVSYHGGSRLLVEAVRVASDLRGSGIGAAMMTWAVDRARAKGCRLVQLTSNRERTRAHAFYERLGFEPTHVGFKLHL